MGAAETLTDDLLDFIETLRADGYNIGAGQFIHVQNLILVLAARGQLPEDPARLHSYIAPIVCDTPERQADFERQFTRWAEAREVRFDAAPAAEPVQPAKRTLERDLERARRVGVWLRWGVAPLTAAALVLFVVLLSRPEPAPIPIPAPPPDTAVGVETPAVVPSSEGQGTTGALWLVGIVAAALLIQQLVQYLTARRFLASRVTEDTPSIAHLLVRGEETQLFDRKLMFRAAQNFRLHRRLGPAQLDVEASVLRTAYEPGVFRRVEIQRMTVPEYLLLVDRLSYRDHQARFFDDLIDWLIEHGVFIHRYYFAGDPRVCHPDERFAPKNARPASLNDLHARYPYRRLMIFSDGGSLFSPFTGKLEGWADQLEAWPLRALLTPEDPANWGPREERLASTGMLLYPATEAGLAALVENPGSSLQWRGRVDDSSRPLPPSLASRPDRWTDDFAPDPEVVEELIQDVRWFLGGDAGQLWLAACAVYPELHWPLTLRLGRTLSDSDGQPLMTQERLSQLYRLPWFRHGRMPAWLRSRLISDLRPQQRNAIQNVIDALLESALHKPGDSEVLEVALDNPVPALGRRIFGMLKRREPRGSALREHVFATFMADRLSVPVPQTLRRFFAALGPLGGILERPVRRLRNATRLLIAVAASIWLLLFLADRADAGPWAHFIVAAGLYSIGISLVILGQVVQHTRVRVVAAVFIGAAIFTAVAEGLSPGEEPLWRSLVEFALAGVGVLVMLPAWHQWRNVSAATVTLGTLRIGRRLIGLSLAAVLLPIGAAIFAFTGVGLMELVAAVALVHLIPLSGGLIVLGYATQTRGLAPLGILFPLATLAVVASIYGVVGIVAGSVAAGAALSLAGASFLAWVIARSARWYRRARPVLESARASSAEEIDIELEASVRTMRRAARVLLGIMLPVWLTCVFAPSELAALTTLIVLYCLNASLAAIGFAGANAALSWFGSMSALLAGLTIVFGLGWRFEWQVPINAVQEGAATYLLTVGGYLWWRAWRSWPARIAGGARVRAEWCARHYSRAAGIAALLYLLALAASIVGWLTGTTAREERVLFIGFYLGAQAVPLTIALMVISRAASLRHAEWISRHLLIIALAQVPMIFGLRDLLGPPEDRVRGLLLAGPAAIVTAAAGAAFLRALRRWDAASGRTGATRSEAWLWPRRLLFASAAAQLVYMVAILLAALSGVVTMAVLIGIGALVGIPAVVIAIAQIYLGHRGGVTRAWLHGWFTLGGIPIHVALMWSVAAVIEGGRPIGGPVEFVLGAAYVLSLVVFGFYWHGRTSPAPPGEKVSAAVTDFVPAAMSFRIILMIALLALLGALGSALLIWSG